jgi:hypothetical protein
MYPASEEYWLSLLANPAAGSANGVAYARRADRTPHLVVSRTLDRVALEAARTVRDPAAAVTGLYERELGAREKFRRRDPDDTLRSPT